MLISLVYACYNEKDTLLRVKAHLYELASYDWIEVIIADGASSDGTLQLLDRARLIITSQQDSGIYDAWNRGLSFARGDYIAFLGLSDKISIDFLRSASEMNNSRILFIYGNALRELRGSQRFIQSSDSPNLFNPESKVKKFDFVHQGCLHHRSLFVNKQFRTDLMLSSDLEFYLKNGDIIHGKFLKLDLIQAVVQYDGVSTTLKGSRIYYKEKGALSKEYPGIDLGSNIFVYLLSFLISEGLWFKMRLLKWRIRRT